MKKIGILAIGLLTVLMLVSMYPVPVSAQPRADADIIFYENEDTLFAALRADEVDFMQWSLTKTQKEAAEADDNLQVVSYTENGMMEFDLNNNYTIMDYPNARSPTNEVKVRQALAYLINKDYIVEYILEFYGSRIDQPIPLPQIGWCNESVIGDNYPYPYDPDMAAALLAELGFSDTDGNGYLNYPADWPGAEGLDTTAMPLKICIRSDHKHRWDAGKYLWMQLEGNPDVGGDGTLAKAKWPDGYVGGDFDTTDVTWEKDRAVLSPIVMGDFNYHIYTGGWSVGRYPTYLFFLFHSMFSYPYGPNYVTNHEHPLLDEYLAGIYYAPDMPTAMANCKKACGYMADYVTNIPMWSYTSYWAYRKEIAGVVNMDGYGLDNDLTFINAYRTDNPAAPLRMGVKSGPDRLNTLYSQWYFERAFLDRVTTGLISVNPYALEVDQPWVAQDWEPSTWEDNGVTKTKVTYWLRKDVGCAAPWTGDFAGFFNAHELEFQIWYNYAYDDSWMWDSFMDVHHTKIIDDYTIEVYFDDYSMWFTYAPTFIGVGPKATQIDLLCEVATATFTAPAPGDEIQFTTDQVVQVISATADGTPIHECTNFYIRAGYDVWCHNVFVNENVPEGASVTINYYKAIPGGAGGFYLGGNLGLDWKDTMYSYGTHYPIAVEPYVGGFCTLNKNPYFFMETPPLGEVDWKWYWEGTEKPRSGHYKIDILDVVKATAAYCSRGDGIFDPRFLAGADLDASDLCHVGILDLVTITGKYAEKFAIPP